MLKINIVYFCNYDLFDSGVLSIKKKIYGQLESFRMKGFSPYLIFINKYSFCVLNFSFEQEKKVCLGKEDLYLNILNAILKINPSIIYIRHSICSFFLIQFYKLLNEKCGNSRMIIEFPTIPYDKEFKLDSKGNIPDNLYIDIFYRKYLKNLFSLSTNFNNLNDVFGIKSIPIKNGISLPKTPIKKSKIDKKREIILIGVASLSEWHGYERILEGIYEYYNKYIESYKYFIKFNIVGTGSSLKILEDICIEYKLNDYICFTGLADGKKLDDYFEDSDIAVGSLGFYKVGNNNGSPLKTKEYCARGIPFIIGYNDLSFGNESEYIMKVANNNSPVDMRKVIKFYESTQIIDNLSVKMRKYAEDNLSWEKSMKNLFIELKI